MPCPPAGRFPVFIGSNRGRATNDQYPAPTILPRHLTGTVSVWHYRFPWSIGKTYEGGGRPIGQNEQTLSLTYLSVRLRAFTHPPLRHPHSDQGSDQHSDIDWPIIASNQDKVRAAAEMGVMSPYPTVVSVTKLK